MKIHEYQAKQILARYGVAVPKGIACRSVDDAEAAAQRLIAETGSQTIVVKAQIHAGGRGKGGGVKVVRDGVAGVRAAVTAMLGSKLVTHQTGPAGQTVRRIYLEQGVDIARELYVGLVIDRRARRVAVMASADGGMEIEQVAAKTPERILTEVVDPVVGLSAYQARNLARGLRIEQGSANPKATRSQFAKLTAALTRVFEAEDCQLCEVNPLVITRSGDIIALDAKLAFDDNAAFRHPEWKELRDPDEEDPVEVELKEAGLTYISLDGNIGCLVNGAGLAMATMDAIQFYGGQPANFLDAGGSANREQITKAFQTILKSSKVQAIFVSIFGGIMKCDVLAEGIVAATRDLRLTVPLVVRMAGTNVERGREILAASGLAIQSADSMADGARKAVQAAAGKN
jgi:succinyl-CoA synthetase beta subunit